MPTGLHTRSLCSGSKASDDVQGIGTLEPLRQNPAVCFRERLSEVYGRVISRLAPTQAVGLLSETLGDGLSTGLGHGDHGVRDSLDLESSQSSGTDLANGTKLLLHRSP
jgi:hypothetical protein